MWVQSLALMWTFVGDATECSRRLPRLPFALIPSFNYRVWLSRHNFCHLTEPESKTRVDFDIKTFIEMFMFPYFPEIKFLSVICVHFPFPLVSRRLTCSSSIFTMLINCSVFCKNELRFEFCYSAKCVHEHAKTSLQIADQLSQNMIANRRSENLKLIAKCKSTSWKHDCRSINFKRVLRTAVWLDQTKLQISSDCKTQIKMLI